MVLTASFFFLFSSTSTSSHGVRHFVRKRYNWNQVQVWIWIEGTGFPWASFKSSAGKDSGCCFKPQVSMADSPSMNCQQLMLFSQRRLDSQGHVSWHQDGVCHWVRCCRIYHQERHTRAARRSARFVEPWMRMDLWWERARACVWYSRSAAICWYIDRRAGCHGSRGIDCMSSTPVYCWSCCIAIGWFDGI